MGPYSDDPIPEGSIFAGTAEYMWPPSNVEEIDPPRRADAGLVDAPEAAFWFSLRFEKGVVQAAFELSQDFGPGLRGGGSPGEGAPILKDVRFFRPKAR